jgi:hypothetical protein
MKRVTAFFRMITIYWQALNSKIFISPYQKLKLHIPLLKKCGISFATVLFFASNCIAQTPATALSCDGIDDYVTIGNTTLLSFPTQSVTLQASLYPTGPGTPVGGGMIINKEGEYEIARWPDGTLRYAIALSGANWFWINTGINIPLNVWTQVTFEYNRAENSILIYINGILSYSNPTFGDITDAEPMLDEFRIGGRQLENTQHFEGSIDEVRVWSKALSSTEIQSTLTCELTGSQTNLVAYYKLDAGFVNQNNAGIITAIDASGNNLNGTLNGFALSGSTSNWTTGAITTSCNSCANPTPIISANGPTTFCSGGSVTLSANTGAGYSYQWKLNGNNISGATNSSYTVTAAGNYSVTITFPGGCSATSAATSVIVNPSLSVSLGVNRYVLYGALGYTGCASLTPVITGGIPPFTFSWTSSDGLFNGFTTPSINPCNTTEVVRTYAVTVTTANGCTATASVNLTFINIACSTNGNNVKVKVCLRPPGNPGNCHTICVSVNAYQALLDNGSYLGDCLPLCATPPYARSGNTSISEYFVKDGLFSVKVMNNPTETFFRLYVSGGNFYDNINIRVIDITGRLIEQKTFMNTDNEIKLGEKFFPGIYLAEITKGANQKTVKLIKQ